MELDYTYWEADDGLLVGYLNDYPGHLTQGHNLAELEEMLADVYQIRQEEEKRLALSTSTAQPCLFPISVAQL
jgi:predicted RNase H-like HicB family nuclease